MAVPPARRSRGGGCVSTVKSLLPFVVAVLVNIVLVNIFWMKQIAPKLTDINTSSSTRETSVSSSLATTTSLDVDFDSSLVLQDANSTFSACLLVMDDNHRLVEWLAYHWFLLPLRHLVILPDSKSRTSPKEVLDRWNKHMKIEIWNDDDFMDDNLREFAKSKENSTAPGDGFLVHTHRQEAFYKRCAVHLQEQQRTWTAFVDVDEFVVINSDVVPDSKRRMQQPGGLLNLVQEIRSLKHEKSKHYNGPCITTYRTLYGAVESTEEELRNEVPDFLDPLRFDTLRWRYHQKYTDFQHGKAFADVSLIKGIAKRGFPNGLNGTRRVSLHRFLPICLPPVYHSNAYLRINHYLGSWEQYSFRDDRRKGGIKNRGIYEEQAAIQDGGSSDEIRPWIGAFTQFVGEEKAKHLLQGSGLEPTYKSTDTQSWKKVDG